MRTVLITVDGCDHCRVVLKTMTALYCNAEAVSQPRPLLVANVLRRDMETTRPTMARLAGGHTTYPALFTSNPAIPAIGHAAFMKLPLEDVHKQYVTSYGVQGNLIVLFPRSPEELEHRVIAFLAGAIISNQYESTDGYTDDEDEGGIDDNDDDDV